MRIKPMLCVLVTCQALSAGISKFIWVNSARHNEINEVCLQILFADKRLVCQCGYVEIMLQATIVAAVDSICKE